MSMQSLTRNVGNGSNKHDLDGELVIILRTASSETWLNFVNGGGLGGGVTVILLLDEQKLSRMFLILSRKKHQNDLQVPYLTALLEASLLGLC